MNQDFVLQPIVGEPPEQTPHRLLVATDEATVGIWISLETGSYIALIGDRVMATSLFAPRRHRQEYSVRHLKQLMRLALETG
ncbi:MAG: hypothetical protein WCJ21_03820 [Planctomycetota bacterium]